MSPCLGKYLSIVGALARQTLPHRQRNTSFDKTVSTLPMAGDTMVFIYLFRGGSYLSIYSYLKRVLIDTSDAFLQFCVAAFCIRAVADIDHRGEAQPRMFFTGNVVQAFSRESSSATLQSPDAGQQVGLSQGTRGRYRQFCNHELSRFTSPPHDRLVNSEMETVMVPGSVCVQVFRVLRGYHSRHERLNGSSRVNISLVFICS